MNKIYRKVTLVALLAIISVVALPLAASAFYNAGFYYNTENSKLSGGVYTKDPMKVKVQFVDQQSSVTEVTYEEHTDLYKIGYDDNNTPLWSVGFRNVYNQEPANVRVSDDDGETWTTLDRRETWYEAYPDDETEYNAYRIPASERYSSVSAATYSYVQADDELFQFTPSDDWVDEYTNPSDQMTAISLYFGADDLLDFSKLSKEDFIVYDETTDTAIELSGVQPEQLTYYNEDWTEATHIDSTSTIYIKLDESLIPDHRYKVSLSSTAGGDEIKRLPAGTYNLALFVGKVNSFMLDEDESFYFHGMNYHPFRQVIVTNPNQPEQPQEPQYPQYPQYPTIPNTPSAPPSSVSSGTDGVALKPGGDSVKSENGSDGRVNLTVTLTDEDLSKAFDALKDSASGPQKIIVNIEQKGDSTKVELPAALLAERSSSNADTVVMISSGSGSIDLPIQAVNYADIAKQLGAPIGDVKLTVTMSDPTATQEELIRNQASAQNISIVNVVNFTITAEAGGKSQEITNFGTTYVPRTIVVTEGASGKQHMAVIIDPATGELQFIPASVDAKGNIVIMAPHASLYAIVEKPNVAFADVRNHWAKADIEALASRLLVKGTTGETFSPDKQINRGEFTALIARALGLEMVKSDTAFTDVAANSWYAKSVRAAVEAGIVQGRTVTTFDPSATITREEMSVMLARALAFVGRQPDVTMKQDGLLSAFEDYADISAWAQTAVAQSAETKLLRGDAQGNFNPQANATRAEAVVTLKRLIEFLKFI